MAMRLDFTNQDYFRDAAARLEALRAAGPVVEAKFPIVGKVWVTTTYEAAGRVLKDNQTFTLRKDGGAVAGFRWWMPRIVGTLVNNPDLENLAASLRGDAILYLEDTIDKEDPLGFHNLHFSGIPFGFVFTEISGQMGEPWQVTLSHEALELIADAEVNRLIMGPHPDPAQKGRMVFHWYANVRRRPGRALRDQRRPGLELRPAPVLHRRQRARRPQRLPRYGEKRRQQASVLRHQPWRLCRLL